MRRQFVVAQERIAGKGERRGEQNRSQNRHDGVDLARLFGCKTQHEGHDQDNYHRGDNADDQRHGQADLLAKDRLQDRHAFACL